MTIAALLFIGIVFAIGALRSDPARNPPPAAYVPAACEAFLRLSAAADHLATAVTAVGHGDLDVAGDERAAGQAEATAANEAIRELPPWPPGEPFDELLASLIITVLPALDELGGADPDLGQIGHQSGVADQLVAEGRAVLDEERYGFGCP